MWEELSKEEKIRFKDFCDRKHGVSFATAENGEPLYFDDELCLINTDIVIELLFSSCLN